MLSYFTTKRGVLIASFACSVFFGAIILFFWQFGEECQRQEWCRVSGSLIVTLLAVLTVPVCVFFFSLIMYKMEDAIFNTWIKFVYAWAPLMILFDFLFTMPSSGTGGLGIAGAMGRSFATFILSLLYLTFFAVSIFIIIWKWYKLRGK